MTRLLGKCLSVEPWAEGAPKGNSVSRRARALHEYARVPSLTSRAECVSSA